MSADEAITVFSIVSPEFLCVPGISPPRNFSPEFRLELLVSPELLAQYRIEICPPCFGPFRFAVNAIFKLNPRYHGKHRRPVKLGHLARNINIAVT